MVVSNGSRKGIKGPCQFLDQLPIVVIRFLLKFTKHSVFSVLEGKLYKLILMGIFPFD